MKIKAIAFLVLLLAVWAGTPQTLSGGEAYIFASDIIKSLDSFYRGEKHIYEKYQEGKTYAKIEEIEHDINIYRKGLANAILLVKPYLNHKIQSIRFTAQKITSSYQQGLNLFDLVSDQMLKKPNEVKFITILDYENALKEIATNVTVTIMALIERNMLSKNQINALKDQLIKTFGETIKVEPKEKTLNSVLAAHGFWWALTKE
ncbi:MAG: hypothetical protein A2W74_07805 [Planctomycetes bacterium RIFCSPLOWO2_12_38_17]|nr:MAG: hypothetical protein A2W74_07805 [Planctomycetes bacterium RIFCSPLOWO2_12_38_17]